MGTQTALANKFNELLLNCVQELSKGLSTPEHRAKLRSMTQKLKVVVSISKVSPLASFVPCAKQYKELIVARDPTLFAQHQSSDLGILFEGIDLSQEWQSMSESVQDTLWRHLEGLCTLATAFDSYRRAVEEAAKVAAANDGGDSDDFDETSDVATLVQSISGSNIAQVLKTLDANTIHQAMANIPPEILQCVGVANIQDATKELFKRLQVKN